MRSEDLRFQVLRHLEQEPDMTQRELAAALGISLAGATARNLWLAQLRHSGAGRTKSSGTILNSFSWPDRAHATDGVRNPFLLHNSRHKRAYLYKLTPQGLSEKAALALRFLRIEALRAEIGQTPLPEQHDQGE